MFILFTEIDRDGKKREILVNIHQIRKIYATGRGTTCIDTGGLVDTEILSSFENTVKIVQEVTK